MNDQIAAFEALVADRPPEAPARMLDLLMRLASMNPGPERVFPGDADADPGRAATRLATAIGACLLDPATRYSEVDYARLAIAARAIEGLFAASEFGSTDHLLVALGAHDGASLARLWREDRQRGAKAMLLLSLDSALPIEPEALFAAPLAHALLAYLNLLASKKTCSHAGMARRERLIELAARLEGASLPRSTDHLVLLSSAWMLCSYAAQRDKHQVKRVLNRILRAWLPPAGMTDAVLPPARALVERPLLLMAAEIMHSNHVQYRYFGQYLRQLRQRFRLALLTEDGQADEHVRALFDEVHLYKRGRVAALADAVALVKRLQPDLIFFPSVGMRHWGPALANLRLAPIQFTALGHSASTFCDSVDYYLTEQGYVGDASLLSEQVILLSDESLVFERSPHYRPVPVAIREHANPLRIALPSNVVKLNAAFVDTLRRISAQAGRPLEFRVFPNVSGLELHNTRRMLEPALPDCRVSGVLSYNRYLAALADCDLNLSAFPFGGLNSVVDSLRLGLPVVAMEGLDLHARTDAMLLRRLGMPEWLISHDVEGYVAAALRLIRDDRLRIEVSRQALALDVDRVLFGDGSTPLRGEVVDAVWWMYRHHEAVKASGRRSFNAAERAAFSPA